MPRTTYLMNNTKPTVSEHLEDSSLTFGNRFKTMRDALKMTDAGTPKWRTVMDTLGAHAMLLRMKLLKIKK